MFIRHNVPYLLDCKPRLIKFFFIILCGLHFFFISSTGLDDLSLSLATFFQPNSLFTFYYLQHHMLIRHRRDYDEQKAVVVV